MALLGFFLRETPQARKRGAGRVRRPLPHRQRLTLTALEERLLLSYTITDIGTLGGTLSNGNALNNRGQVAGGSLLQCQCIDHPFLWDRGVLHDLGFLGGALGINDLGQVVGVNNANGDAFLWSRQAGMTDLGFHGWADKINNKGEIVGQIVGTPSEGFLWRDGSLLRLGALTKGGGSTATDINNAGQIVGQAGAIGGLHAFIWSEAEGMTDLGTLDGNPASTSGATFINDRGQAVGFSYAAALGTTHAVYFGPGGPQDLGSLGGDSEANAVNDWGQVVGYSAGGAFLTDLNGGPMVSLNSLIPPGSGWNLFDATGINNAGQIAGSGQLPGYDNIHAYLLTPDDPPAVALISSVPELGKPQPVGTEGEFLPPPVWTPAPPGNDLQSSWHVRAAETSPVSGSWTVFPAAPPSPANAEGSPQSGADVLTQQSWAAFLPLRVDLTGYRCPPAAW